MKSLNEHLVGYFRWYGKTDVKRRKNLDKVSGTRLQIRIRTDVEIRINIFHVRRAVAEEIITHETAK